MLSSETQVYSVQDIQFSIFLKDIPCSWQKAKSRRQNLNRGVPEPVPERYSKVESSLKTSNWFKDSFMSVP